MGGAVSMLGTFESTELGGSSCSSTGASSESSSDDWLFTIFSSLLSFSALSSAEDSPLTEPSSGSVRASSSSLTSGEATSVARSSSTLWSKGVTAFSLVVSNSSSTPSSVVAQEASSEDMEAFRINNSSDSFVSMSGNPSSLSSFSTATSKIFSNCASSNSSSTLSSSLSEIS